MKLKLFRQFKSDEFLTIYRLRVECHLYGGVTEDGDVVYGPPQHVQVLHVGQNQLHAHHLPHHLVGGLESRQTGLQQTGDVVHQENLPDLFVEGGRDAHRVLLDVVDDGRVGDVVVLPGPAQTESPAPTEEEQGEDQDQQEEGGSTDEGEHHDDAALVRGDVRQVDDHIICRDIVGARQSAPAASLEI